MIVGDVVSHTVINEETRSRVRRSANVVQVAELGHGIATALTFYAELGFTSYNLALYGTGGRDAQPDMLLRMVCRANPEPWYRSDVMWLERLHHETAVDLWPEDVADRAGDRFRR
jgi:hypothetical protein